MPVAGFLSELKRLLNPDILTTLEIVMASRFDSVDPWSDAPAFRWNGLFGHLPSLEHLCISLDQYKWKQNNPLTALGGRESQKFVLPRLKRLDISFIGIRMDSVGIECVDDAVRSRMKAEFEPLQILWIRSPGYDADVKRSGEFSRALGRWRTCGVQLVVDPDPKEVGIRR
jgi:hypothetical protein